MNKTANLFVILTTLSAHYAFANPSIFLVQADPVYVARSTEPSSDELNLVMNDLRRKCQSKTSRTEIELDVTEIATIGDYLRASAVCK